MNFYFDFHRNRNKIFYRGYEDGEEVYRKVDFYPELFISDKNSTEPWRSISGIRLSTVNPGKMSDCKKYIEERSDINGVEIFGNENYATQFIVEKFPDEVDYDLDKIRIASLDIETACERGFPEPTQAVEDVLVITYRVGDDYYVFFNSAYGNWSPDDSEKTFHVFSCADSNDLVYKFLRFWNENPPHIVTGWNIRGFDIPYLYNYSRREFGDGVASLLSPWGDVSERTFVEMGRETTTYDISGISTLDYMELYKKYTYTAQESYSLDYISSIELGEKKLDYSEHDSLHSLYLKDFHKYVNYNIRDVDLVSKLEDKMKLIELVITMAYDAKVNYSDVLSQVKTWDSIIYSYLYSRNIIVPIKNRTEKTEAFSGAYVKDPILGRHKWVVSFDLNSLYPHLIQQYAIGPDTLVCLDDIPQDSILFKDNFKLRSVFSVDRVLGEEVPREYLDELKRLNYSVTPNGALFKRDRVGFLGELMEKMYEDRKLYKKEMLKYMTELEQEKDENRKRELIKYISKNKNLQMSKKIQMNSAYGAIGNQYFRLFDVKLAEAITCSGQLSIRWIEKKLNEFLNSVLKTDGVDYIIASDTDSVYINFSPLVEKYCSDFLNDTSRVVSYLDKICSEKIQEIIDGAYGDLATYVNAYSQKMFMKRECIADVGIWTAKKRYIMNVWNSEGVGYNEAKIKVMGLEMIKSSTPSAVREFMKESMKIIIGGTEDEMIAFIQKKREEFKARPIQEISFPRGVSDVDKYKSRDTLYSKGCPIHVRGAILYNSLLEEKNIKSKFKEIYSGDKLKYIYLKIPNPIRNDVISFLGSLPDEFGLKEYINYDLQFEKSFVQPLKAILDVIGWKTEKTASLESLFL